MIDTISREINQTRDCALFIPWFGEENVDHKETYEIDSNLIRKITSQIKIQIWMYEVWTPLVPNVSIDITQQMIIKKQALRFHKSQLKSLDYISAINGLNAYRGLLMPRAKNMPNRLLWCMRIKCLI